MFCSQFHSALTALTITIKSVLNEIYRVMKNAIHFVLNVLIDIGYLQWGICAVALACIYMSRHFQHSCTILNLGIGLFISLTRSNVQHGIQTTRE